MFHLESAPATLMRTIILSLELIMGHALAIPWIFCGLAHRLNSYNLHEFANLSSFCVVYPTLSLSVRVSYFILILSSKYFFLYWLLPEETRSDNINKNKMSIQNYNSHLEIANFPCLIQFDWATIRLHFIKTTNQNLLKNLNINTHDRKKSDSNIYWWWPSEEMEYQTNNCVVL